MILSIHPDFVDHRYAILYQRKNELTSQCFGFVHSNTKSAIKMCRRMAEDPDEINVWAIQLTIDEGVKIRSCTDEALEYHNPSVLDVEVSIYSEPSRVYLVRDVDPDTARTVFENRLGSGFLTVESTCEIGDESVLVRPEVFREQVDEAYALLSRASFRHLSKECERRKEAVESFAFSDVMRCEIAIEVLSKIPMDFPKYPLVAQAQTVLDQAVNSTLKK